MRRWRYSNLRSVEFDSEAGWPAASDRPVQRNYRAVPLAPLSALPPRLRPAWPRSHPPALRTPALHTLPYPAPATPSDPPSRSASAASPPTAHTPPAPCTPAASPSNALATPPRSPIHRQRRSTPPIASPLVRLPAPLPSPAALLHDSPGPPLSLPTRSGILGSSPENHSAPKTRCSRPPATAPNPPSCTPAHRLFSHTGPAQIALPSTPAGSNILALPPLHRYTTPRPLPPAPALPAHPICTPACSQSAVRSVRACPTSPVLL